MAGDVRHKGGTPMLAALLKSLEVMADWCDNHKNS